MENKQTINSVVAKIREFKNLIKKRFWVVLIYVTICAGIGYFLASRSERVYKATATFMMDSGGKGGMASAYAGLARQFGMGGGGGSDGLNSDKLAVIVRSKKNIYGGLMLDAVVDGKKDLLVNHYIEKIMNKDREKKITVHFKKGDDKNFSFEQDSILLQVYGDIMLNEYTALVSKKEGISTLTFNSKNEEIAVAVIRNTLNYLIGFYTIKSVEKEQRTVDHMTHKVDSLQMELQIAENQLAGTKDQNVGMARAAGMLDEVRLVRKIKMLSALYGEGVKNLEVARFSLLEKEVIIQKIDEPRRPLPWQKLGKIKAIIIGMFLGTLLGIAAIIIKKQYNSIIKNA